VSDFSAGQCVWYEIRTKDGRDFRVPAVVVEARPRRVVEEFTHWGDGRLVRRVARPHRVSPRPS